MSQSFPNPILSANLYCSGRLDDALHRVVYPFWQRTRQESPDGYVWVQRYSRGGEHLKIRIHGPEELQAELRQSLEELTHEYLATLAEVPAGPQVNSREAPPIDPEDKDEEHPDRSLLWTTYRHSPVTLGAEPFLADESYTAQFTRCLGDACERVVESLIPGDDATFTFRARQSLIFKLAIVACPAFGFDSEKRVEYLTYHRDWLIRFLLTKADPAKADRDWMIKTFDAKANASIVETLAGAMASRDREDGSADEFLALRRSLAGFFDHVRGFRDDPRYNLDPYTQDHSFLPIFKVLHGVANQAGLAIPNEAYTYHLLLRAAELRQSEERGAA